MEIFLLISGLIAGGLCGWFVYQCCSTEEVELKPMKLQPMYDRPSPPEWPSLNLEINNWLQSDPKLKAHYFPDGLKGYVTGSSTALCGRAFYPNELLDASHVGFEDRCSTCTKLKNGN